MKYNEGIRAPEVMVISNEGESLGVMSREEAIKKAKEAGLDLVEISASANPPVTKITSYDRYRFQLEKTEREKKKKTKSSEVRSVRITPRAATNDLEVKLKKVREFLEEGDKVEVQLFLKGREKANKDFARVKLEEFLAKIEMEIRVISPIKYAGRGFTTQITKK